MLNPLKTAEPWKHEGHYVFGRHDAISDRMIGEVMGAFSQAKRRKPQRLVALPLSDPNPDLRRIARVVELSQPDLTFHALRKTFARVADEACDFYTVKRFLGHSLAGDVTSGYLLR